MSDLGMGPVRPPWQVVLSCLILIAVLVWIATR